MTFSLTGKDLLNFPGFPDLVETLSVTARSDIPYHIRMHVLLEVGFTQAAVPVVRDVAAVHDLAEQVAQVLPRHLGVRLQVVVQHVDADGQVSRVVRVHPGEEETSRHVTTVNSAEGSGLEEEGRTATHRTPPVKSRFKGTDAKVIGVHPETGWANKVTTPTHLGKSSRHSLVLVLVVSDVRNLVHAKP